MSFFRFENYIFQLTVCVYWRHPPPSSSVRPRVVASAPAVRGGRPAGGRGRGRGEAADAEGLGGADEAGQLGWGKKRKMGGQCGVIPN